MKLLSPVDIGAALREPGHPEDESARALLDGAVRGGCAKICPRPFTSPLPTTGAEIKRQAALGLVPAGTLTIDGALTEIGEMLEAGARVLWDHPAERDERVLRAALEYAAGCPERPVIAFEALSGPLAKGVWMESEVSTQFGLPAIPEIAETLQVARVIELARATDARVVIAGLSTARGAAMVERAKAEGIDVWATVELINLVHTVEVFKARPYDPALRVWPPPRSAKDRDALRAGVAQGHLLIASGHGPRAPEKQDRVFDRAAPGHETLEDALGIALSLLSAEVVERAYSAGPRELLGLAPEGPSVSVEGKYTVKRGPFAGESARRIVSESSN